MVASSTETKEFLPSTYRAKWEGKSQQEILKEIQRLSQLMWEIHLERSMRSLWRQRKYKKDILLSLLEFTTGYEGETDEQLASQKESLEHEEQHYTSILNDINRKLLLIEKEMKRRYSQ